MERVIPTTGDVPFAVFVDGASTPEALERALAEVRAATKGRVVCVLGCGDHDDPATCARLGEVATGGASVVYVTGAGREPVSATAADAVVEGLRRNGYHEARGRSPFRDDFVVVRERGVAVARAIEFAREWDGVVLVGDEGGLVDNDIERARAALDERAARPYDPWETPPERRLHRVTPERRDTIDRNVRFERLAETEGKILSRLVLRKGAVFEVNFGEPVDVVVYCEKGACNVVSFGPGNCDIAAGETLRGSVHTLYFQETGDELVLLILAHG